MITIYVVSYNEELMIQFMIDHYRKRFPNCNIILFDNMSTDNTVQIALDNDIDVIPFYTNNTFSDGKNMEIKNNAWKTAPTDWVLTCDMDELLDINEDQLKLEKVLGTTIIRGEGYNMVNMKGASIDLNDIKYGDRCTRYDKAYLFNKTFISEINYGAGCHECSPKGIIKFNTNQYKTYHYNFINLDLVIKKYKRNNDRLSEENKKKGWGIHYFFTEQQITDELDRKSVV